MKRKSVTFVSSSEFFKGFQELWDLFADSDPECSWGNNSFSLVPHELIINHLSIFIRDCKMDGLLEPMQQLKKRVRSLKANVYVDLES